MKIITLIFSITCLLACNDSETKENTITIFSKPIIVQSPTKYSTTYFQINHINSIFPMYLGKFEFGDTLFLPGQGRLDSNYIKKEIENRIRWQSDSIATDGFEIFTDYASEIYQSRHYDTIQYCYYPVYIVNQTPVSKTFFGKDSYVFAIQEALDSKRQWRPIEGRSLDFCGNGYWKRKVHPQEFITVLFPKYSGNFKTRIRVRLEIGNNMYVSKSFIGYINESQFLLEENSYLKDKLIQNQLGAINHLFYGSIPLEIEDEYFGLHAVTSK